MERLWAPWREKYIIKTYKKCVFCNYKEEKDLVVFKGKKSFIMLNKFPYNAGHLLVAPYRHITKFEELSKEEAIEIMDLIRKSIIVLNNLMHPQGYNIGTNIGKIAGAGFSHFHFHIVPRWKGDTNFMPVISNVKVISTSLVTLRGKLREKFLKTEV